LLSDAPSYALALLIVEREKRQAAAACDWKQPRRASDRNGFQAAKAPSSQPTNISAAGKRPWRLASGHDGGSLHVGQSLRPFVLLPCGGLASGDVHW